MIDLKAAIVAALKADTQLISLLGGPRIYSQPAPDETEKPRISYFELDNISAIHADDAELESEIHIQIDIWNAIDGSNTAIAERVDAVMDGIGFARTGCQDLYEQETKTQHKAMRFRGYAEV